jgi:hypothetical protein
MMLTQIKETEYSATGKQLDYAQNRD